MPAHIRSTLRAALKSQLQSALPTTPIYANRSRPIGLKDAGQTVEILTPRERLTRLNGDIEYEREIEGMLIGYVAATSEDEAADNADLLALQLEAAVHADETLGGVVQDIWLTGTDFALDGAAYANANFALSFRALVNISISEMESA